MTEIRRGRMTGAAVKELAIVGGLLLVLAAVVFGPHARHGGFLSDDWAIYALLHFSDQQGFLGGIDALLEQPNIAQRPGFAIYLGVVGGVFGMHMGWYLAWAAAMGALLVLSVYWVLRLLKLPVLVAGAVSVLILLFPGADAMRLWITASGVQLATAIAVLAFGLAILAFRAEGRRSLGLHAASVALYAASVLFQEGALALMCASVLLYLLVAQWRKAVMRWAVDLTVLLPIAVLVTSRSSFERQDGAGMVEHAEAMLSGAQTLLMSVVLPVVVDEWLVLAVAVLVLGAAVAVARSLRHGDPDRAQLRLYVVATLAGVGVVVAGYAMYVPAIDYYTPRAYGIGNRVNNVASIGWMLCLVSIVMLAATLACRAVSWPRRYAQAITVCAMVLVALEYVGQLRTDAGRYQRAYATGARALATMRASVPKPPANAVVWTFGQPIEQVPGIPIFGNTWDMTTSVQLMWRDPTLSSVPAYPGLRFDCRATAVEPAGSRFGKSFRAAYGKSYFVDTVTGTYAVPRSQAECLEITRRWKRSPPTAEPGGYDS
ncbi:MAG: hypothetical protein M3131_04380 [Actinomycetota bacterium]|nr:hypothetical protein [Actinomycetota bacterium]